VKKAALCKKKLGKNSEASRSALFFNIEKWLLARWLGVQ